MGTRGGLLVSPHQGSLRSRRSGKASQQDERQKLELAERGMPAGGGFRPLRHRIEARISERTSRLAEHQGWTELDRLGNNPRSVGGTMSADHKRTVSHPSSFITSIRVHRNSGPASSRFNFDRVAIVRHNSEIRAELVFGRHLTQSLRIVM